VHDYAGGATDGSLANRYETVDQSPATHTHAITMGGSTDNGGFANNAITNKPTYVGIYVYKRTV